ncbi:unnamed protein product [Lymnaea stagnalis]|uniref:RNA-binding motif protein, X-linked 2 n=1 Tax=Lymnaea stagnalis TaxID=6523 RepID=A0AAV2ICL2_LYMST
MNPLTNIKNLQKLNERELELGIIGKKSWHDEYKESAWIFVGGLPFDLSEGDIVCVFSQYGEIVNINLVRDHKTGKSKGFAFLCFEDQRSTVLSVDNLNGIKILGRTIRVDHVKEYKVPKEHGDEDEMVLKIRQEGCAPKIMSSSEDEQKEKKDDKNKIKKDAKKKKKKKKKSRKSQSSSSSSDKDEEKNVADLQIKTEKIDPDYNNALNTSRPPRQNDIHKKQPYSKRDGDHKRKKNESGSDVSRDDDGNNSRTEGRSQHDSSSSKTDLCGRLNSNSHGREKQKDGDRGRQRESERGRQRENERGRQRENERGRQREDDKGTQREAERDRQREGDRDRKRDKSRERSRSSEERHSRHQDKHKSYSGHSARQRP